MKGTEKFSSDRLLFGKTAHFLKYSFFPKHKFLLLKFLRNMLFKFLKDVLF